MKTITTIQQLRAFNKSVHDMVQEYLTYDYDHVPLMESTGGDFTVLETPEEVIEVCAREEFDQLYPSDDGLWMVATVINNNSGGPTWLIPSEYSPVSVDPANAIAFEDVPF